MAIIKLFKKTWYFLRNNEKNVELSKAFKNYQQLLDEVEECAWELKKSKCWTIGCLIVGWIIVWMGRSSGHSPYNHPIFGIPIFALAFLAGIKNLEKENKIDVRITQCAIEGIEMEKKRQWLKSSYFQDFVKSYEGYRIWVFAFGRILPSLWVLFSFLYPFAGFVSKFVPSWGVYSGAGMILGLIGIFFGRIACRPYQWLLCKV